MHLAQAGLSGTIRGAVRSPRVFGEARRRLDSRTRGNKGSSLRRYVGGGLKGHRVEGIKGARGDRASDTILLRC